MCMFDSLHLVLNLSANCRCVITGNGNTSYSYLGRPWGPFGRVVFAFSWMDACIKPAGWNNWDKCDNERTACFYEYRYVKHISFDLIFSDFQLIGSRIIRPESSCSASLLNTSLGLLWSLFS